MLVEECRSGAADSHVSAWSEGVCALVHGRSCCEPFSTALSVIRRTVSSKHLSRVSLAPKSDLLFGIPLVDRSRLFRVVPRANFTMALSRLSLLAHLYHAKDQERDDWREGCHRK